MRIDKVKRILLTTVASWNDIHSSLILAEMGNLDLDISSQNVP